MSKDHKIKGIVLAIIIAIVFFGIGMAAGKHSSNRRGQMGMMGDRSTQFGKMGNSAQGGMQNGRMNRGGGIATGEIISLDEKSITIKLQDGGSKVIYLTDTTPVMKSTSGVKSDLATGATVMVNGTTNADGSIAAQSVQIRPAGQAMPTGMPGQAPQAR